MEIKKIVLTGPACCGKTTLAKELATYYDANYVEEYAREYVLALNRPYTYEDINVIARKQLEHINKAVLEAEKNNKQLIFIDTYLVILIVWFEVVFKNVPDWLIDDFKKSEDFVFLLCEPDLKWKEDPAREYGPELQVELFQRYEELFTLYNKKYFKIRGHGKSRLGCALDVIEKVQKKL